MNSHEGQPRLNKSVFDRKSMDPETPHGKAQARWDEIVQVSRMNGGTHVQYNAAGESTEPFNDSANIQKDTARAEHPKKPKKPLKVHDTTGLNGFWKGTLYRDGIAQRPKNRRGK